MFKRTQIAVKKRSQFSLLMKLSIPKLVILKPCILHDLNRQPNKIRNSQKKQPVTVVLMSKSIPYKLKTIRYKTLRYPVVWNNYRNSTFRIANRIFCTGDLLHREARLTFLGIGFVFCLQKKIGDFHTNIFSFWDNVLSIDRCRMRYEDEILSLGYPF